MTGTDPAVGDRVILYGTIRSIDAGVALVEVYRTYPVGGTVAVQCGALELDERKFDGGTPQSEADRIREITRAAIENPGRTATIGPDGSVALQ